MLTTTVKKPLTAMFTLAAVMVVAACGEASEVAPEPEPDATLDEVSRDELDSLRQLDGVITIALEGAVPAPGAPPTSRQEAWTVVLDTYGEFQPNVEVEIIDLPAGQVPDEFCRSRHDAGTMTDISFLDNCDYFRPSAAEIEAGMVSATDFAPYEDEVNPYTGRPWKEDWLSDQVRLARCQEQGAVDMWTCQTDNLWLHSIAVNWDILNEFGASSFPETLTELWELSEEINASGEYVAWDMEVSRLSNFIDNIASLLAMDVYEAGGGDVDNLAVNPWDPGPSPPHAEKWCDGTLWVSNNPSLQEVVRQAERFVQAAGGGAAFFDPTREVGVPWLTGRAAFWYVRTDRQPVINQAERDGTFLVENWSLEYFPDFSADELIDPNVEISFDGKFYVDFAGRGDTFAPAPEVRASGDDENVDLIVRDFLQFLSSRHGQQRVITEGLVSINSELFPLAPQHWVEAIEAHTPVNTEYYQDTTQPPATFARLHHRWDPEDLMEAYMRGDMDFETFIRRADENVTREAAFRLQDNLEQYDLTELPAACQQWGR